MTGAQALIRSLEDLGVTDVFGIPGGAILPVYHAIDDATKFRFILTRHEQGAGHAAEGYARSTGRLGVVHASIAAYLTARYLTSHAVPEHQLRALLTRTNTLGRTRVPSRLRDVGIGRDAFDRMARNALTITRLLDRNVRAVTYDDAMAIYEKAY